MPLGNEQSNLPLSVFMSSDMRAMLQGKVLILITNSGFEYTDKMMSYAFNSFLPSGKKWRDLFDMVRGYMSQGCLYNLAV